MVGFVRSSDVVTTNPIRDRSEPSADRAEETDDTFEGFGFTQLAINAGACLYAIPGGEPVGVQISASIRAGQPFPDANGWWSVTVLTDWGRAYCERGGLVLPRTSVGLEKNTEGLESTP